LPSLHGFFLRKKENDRYEERDDTNVGKKRKEAEVRIVLMRPFRSVGEAFYSTTAKAEVCV
jgi:hypothetical protein